MAPKIFLDANILLYHFTSHPQFGLSCYQLIQSTEVGMINSFTSNWVIAEVIHKLMTLEACDRFHIQSHDIVIYLKKQYRKIKKLSKYRKALALIYQLPNLTVLEIDASIFPSKSHSHPKISVALLRCYPRLNLPGLGHKTCRHE